MRKKRSLATGWSGLLEGMSVCDRLLLLCAAACALAMPPSLRAEDLPLGLTELDPDDAPPPAEASLGKKLFFDKSLSVDGL